MVDWSVPENLKEKREAKRKEHNLPKSEDNTMIIEALSTPPNSIWTNEYPTEFGITSFRRDKILGVTDTSKSILVHMINGHTYTITIKESIIPFFNRDGLTTADVLEDLKRD